MSSTKPNKGIIVLTNMKKKKKKIRKAGKRSGMQIYKRLMRYVLPHWKLFFISIIGFLIYAATQPMFAAVIKHVIDTLQSETRKGVEYLPLLFVGLIIIRGIGAYLGNYFLARVSCNVVHALRCAIFNHYTRLPAVYFDNNSSGYMMSRITHNVGEVTQATTDSARTFVREGFTAIGLFAYLIYMNWQLSLIFIAIAPIIGVLVSYVSKRLRRLSKNVQESVGDMTQITSEMVGGHRIVRSFGGEGYERDRFLERSQFNRGQTLKQAATVAIHSPLMQLVIAIALGILMHLALTIMSGASAGEFVAYLTTAFLLPRPIRLLSDANNAMQRGIAAAESLFEVLDEGMEKDDGVYETSNCKGRIEFKDVSFAYKGIDKKALDNISFTIEPGQTVALVGASGSGKSTLTNLIPRFYEHGKGKILLDGVEINEYKLANLRSQIALVTQHVTLFNDSIFNNIAYGSVDGAVSDRVKRAAKDSYAKDFIEKLPEGFDAMVGEHGVKLSGGQRQRLALARALYKDAPILILDEATSALDTESEWYIQKALEKLMKNRTTLVVAHRLSTIESADVILVMEQGRIVERGTHQQLVQNNGVYSKLQKMQFEGVG